MRSLKLLRYRVSGNFLLRSRAQSLVQQRMKVSVVKDFTEIRFAKKWQSWCNIKRMTPRTKGCQWKNQIFYKFINADVLLWPLLITFKLIGILPLSIRWTTGQHRENVVDVKISHIGFVVSTLLLLITTVHTLWAPQMLIFLEKSILAEVLKLNRIPRNLTWEHTQGIFSSKQTLVVKIIHPLLICITSLTARGLSVSLLPKRLPQLIRKISKIDHILALPSSLWRWNGAVLLVFFVALFVLNIPLMAYHLWQLSSFHSSWGNVWEAFSMLNIFTTFSLELQFMTFCYIVKSRLAFVNEKLGAFVADDFFVAEFLPICSRKKTVLNVAALDTMYGHKERTIRTRNVLSTMRSLRTGHIFLTDVMDDINEIYQLHLLISIFSSLSKILFNLYFSIFGFITSSKRLPNVFQKRQMSIVSLWTAYYCLRFLLIVIFAHVAAAEFKRTRRILSKVDTGALDDCNREEIKLFFEHLSGPDFKFSACGLFYLRMALITSSFSSGITYLVIMAQFR